LHTFSKLIFQKRDSVLKATCTNLSWTLVIAVASLLVEVLAAMLRNLVKKSFPY